MYLSLLLLVVVASAQSIDYDELLTPRISWATDSYLIAFEIGVTEVEDGLNVFIHYKTATNLPDNENVIGVAIDTATVTISVEPGFFTPSVRESHRTLSSVYAAGMFVSDMSAPSEDQLDINWRVLKYEDRYINVPYSLLLKSLNLKNKKYGQLFNIELLKGVKQSTE